MSGMREMMLDGTLCQVCGAFIEQPPADGTPRDCRDCGALRERHRPKPKRQRPAKEGA